MRFDPIPVFKTLYAELGYRSDVILSPVYSPLTVRFSVSSALWKDADHPRHSHPEASQGGVHEAEVKTLVSLSFRPGGWPFSIRVLSARP
jgi:hypothetical protein